MSNLETAPAETECGGEPPEGAVHEELFGREVVLGTRGMLVTRTLPHRDRRMVGAWCFVDHYGPHDITGTAGMRVPPHPHTGLQTVSWLVRGEVLHRDSVGSEQLIEPGGLGIMTSGRGIAHSEETPHGASPVLHGVQLWVALPGHCTGIDPVFEHHPSLPVFSVGAATVTVFVGELGPCASPATVHTPLLGAEILFDGVGELTLPLEPGFEHAALTLTGQAQVDGAELPVGPLLYLGADRTTLTLRTEGPARVLLLGGEPFQEQIVMWWNFVGRSHDDVVAARQGWTAEIGGGGGERFGVVHGYDGAPLPAPELPATPLKPRGRVR